MWPCGGLCGGTGGGRGVTLYSPTELGALSHTAVHSAHHSNDAHYYAVCCRYRPQGMHR